MNKNKNLKLFYADEHLSCFNYSKKNPLIEVIEKEADSRYEIEGNKNVIVFMLRGSGVVSSGMINNKMVSAGKMFVHPGRTKGSVEIIEPAALVIMRLDGNLSFCEHFSIEKLCNENNKESDDIFLLDINLAAKEYLSLLEIYIKTGLKCVYFFELKLKEFLYILRAYYSKEELQSFFRPILNRDMEFSKQVYENIDKVKTVKELSELLNYSVSGFEKKFKRVFDMPASRWMEQNKSRAIYHEINCSNKTIMEIAYDFKFTPPQFNDYCKRVFKKTPKQLRKQAD